MAIKKAIKKTPKKTIGIRSTVKKVVTAPVKYVVKTVENALRTTTNLNKQNAQRAIDAVNKNKRPY